MNDFYWLSQHIKGFLAFHSLYFEFLGELLGRLDYLRFVFESFTVFPAQFFCLCCTMFFFMNIVLCKAIRKHVKSQQNIRQVKEKRELEIEVMYLQNIQGIHKSPGEWYLLNEVARESGHPFQSTSLGMFDLGTHNMQSPMWWCTILLENDGWLKFI